MATETKEQLQQFDDIIIQGIVPTTKITEVEAELAPTLGKGTAKVALNNCPNCGKQFPATVRITDDTDGKGILIRNEVYAWCPSCQVAYCADYNLDGGDEIDTIFIIPHSEYLDALKDATSPASHKDTTPTGS